MLFQAAGASLEKKLYGKDLAASGAGWFKSLKEWHFNIPCVNVQIRL